MSASVRQYKAPYRYARKGRTLVLMERGNATGQTFSSEAAAKRTVLEMNDAWRAKSAKKANPRSRSNPYFGNGLLHDDDVFLDLQAIWKRGISPDVKPYRLRNYTERQTKKFYAQYGSGILNHAADYEMAVADWARTYPPTELMKKANPRPPMRRNFFGIFKSAPPLYRVTAYNRDGSTDVHTATSHPALEIALDEAGIKERAIPGLMAAAEQRPLVDSSGDVFKRMKDAYGWERVTIELVGERPKAKSNPKKYYEGSPDVSESQPYAVKDIRKGEFVKKKKGAKKTYRVEGYDRANRKYALQDWDDISRVLYVKGETLVYFGD